MARKSIQQKTETEQKLAPLFQKAKGLVVAENKGLTVAQVTSLRQNCRQAGVTYKVIKNTMSRRLVQGQHQEGLEPLFTGPTAVAFSPADEAAPIKVIVEFQKKNKEAKIEVKGGWVGNQVFTSQQLAELAKLPGRDALLSQLCSVLQAPMANVAAALAAVLRQVPATIQALADQKQTTEKKS